MKSYQWLKSGDIKEETGETIVAAQGHEISTNYFKNKTMKEETGSKCRLYKQHEETINHLTSGCSILAKNEYLMRHDKVCAHLHCLICKALGIETTNGARVQTHTHQIQCVNRKMLRVLWNQAVHTDREVTANRPDITKTKKKKWTLIDVAIPTDRNVV
jgi:hypothetical protein